MDSVKTAGTTKAKPGAKEGANVTKVNINTQPGL